MTITVQSLLSARWRIPAAPFETVTTDGVRIVGTRLGDPRRRVPAVVLAHGYLGWHRRPRWARFAERLAARFDVFAFDLRGHGASGGITDFGGAEIADVDAVVGLARAADAPRVVTVGASMGAISVIRHGGLIGGVDGVVAISSLASWEWHADSDPRARRAPHGHLEHARRPPLDGDLGRAARIRVAAAARESRGRDRGDRSHPGRDRPRSRRPALRSRPCPAPLRRGREPKRLLLGDRFGHAEVGLSGAFAALLGRVINEMLEASWSP